MAPLTQDAPSVAGDDVGVPRGPAGPSTGPALIVLGIALVVVLAGIIGAALTSSGTATTKGATSLKTAPGATITAVPGRPVLKPIVIAGQPPDDILDAVALPKGTTVKTGSATNNGIGLYDHSLSFTIAVPEQRVIDFFRAELKAFKWEIVSQGSPPNNVPGYRIVGQHPSGDGFEWEIGVTVAPTTFGSPTVTGMTPYTLRLFAVTDN
jgi:hypothetical protein